MATPSVHFQKALAAATWPPSDYGPDAKVPDHLETLWSDDAEAIADAWSGLLGTVWHQGTVALVSSAAIRPLLVCAEDAACPGRAVAAGVLAFIAAGTSSHEGVVASIQSTFAAARAEVEALAERSGVIGEAAKLICDVLDGALAGEDRAEERAREIGDEVEAELHASEDRAYRASRTPDRVGRDLDACRPENRAQELDCLRLLHDALEAGLAARVLEVCAKLRHVQVLAEPSRIAALAALGRKAEGRAAAVQLAKAWLTPPDSVESVNQQLLRSDVLASLDRFATAGDDELRALHETVAATPPPVFIPKGDFF
ncbi:MAG TPA: hypothetical protein VMB50_03720 [Myxococcales bacterium]|nr:hypothetical protein [Myxococcales bacterium]